MTEHTITRVSRISSIGDDFGEAVAGLARMARDEPVGPIDEHLHTVSSFLPIIVLALDDEGRFLWSYGGGLRSLGLADDELVGHTIDDFGPMAEQAFRAALAGDASSLEVEGVTDGEPWTLSMVVAPLAGRAGVAAVAVDTTPHTRAEQDHTRREGLLEAAVEAIDEGVVVQDADGRVVHCNGSAGRTVGVGPDELAEIMAGGGGWTLTRQDGTPLTDDDRPGRRSIGSGVPERGTVVGVTSPDGRQQWLQVNSFPLRLGAEQLVVSTFADVTDQRALTAELQLSEERFRRTAEAAPIGIYTSDADARMVYGNPKLAEITGCSVEQLIERTIDHVIHPDDQAAVAEAKIRFRAGEPFRQEFRVVHPDGTVRWVRARATLVLDGEGEALGAVGTFVDVTDFILADQRLREREERTRAILETAAEGIITADESRRIVEFNAAAERILGYDSEEVVGRLRFDDLLAPAYRPALVAMFDAYLGGRGTSFVGQPATEIDYVRKTGEVVPVELAVSEVLTSEGRLFTGVLHDISERKAFERELEHQATHDALTGLPNRALLVAELDAALHRASRRGSGVGVLFIELGRLKLVTDSLGHRAGDQLVVEAAQRLIRVDVGVPLTVTRFGGEHLVAFAEDLDDVGDAVSIARWLLEELEAPYRVGAEEAMIKPHVGIAFAPVGAGSAESLISNADVAMNRSRSDSGPGYEVFDSEMRAWVDSRRKLEVAMHHGIGRGEFVLHYQPVVELASGEIRGFEALVRWNHPELGLLPPGEFIPLAEDTGLIVPLGEWILQDACRQLAAWQQELPDRALTVSVNLSGIQLAQPELPATVALALLSAGADPTGLDLEITETVLLDDVETAARTLDGLKKIGVNLSMDDFGTGYSSLTYLCRFPIDIVKIDRSFVSQLGTESRDTSVVSLVLGLAQTLQLGVVAEGVETEGQLAALQVLDCLSAQGYLFAKPQPAEEAHRLLALGSVWRDPR